MGVDNVFATSLQTAMRRLSIIPACLLLLLASTRALAQTATDQGFDHAADRHRQYRHQFARHRTFDATTGTCMAVDADTVLPAAATVDFCAANTVFNIGQIAGPPQAARFFRYTIGGTEVAVPELNLDMPWNVNGVMIDPLRNRLLFLGNVGGATSTLYAYDPANGG